MEWQVDRWSVLCPFEGWQGKKRSRWLHNSGEYLEVYYLTACTMASLTKAALFLVTRMLPFLTTKMQLPPQCDPTELLMPQSLDFMGTEVNVTMGT
jgi:hypothetical protein